MVKKISSLVDKVDIGIITMKQEEYTEVVRLIDNPESYDGDKGRRYRIGKVNCQNGQKLTISITRCINQGNIEAQDACMITILDLNPKWIFIVGIAGGIASTDFSLGDVVIASRILDMTVQSIQSGENEFDVKGGELNHLARMVVQDLPIISKIEMSNWVEKIDMTRPGIDLDVEKIKFSTDDDNWNKKIIKSLKKNFTSMREPFLIVGPVISSDKLVKDIEIIRTWKTVARSAVAVEMESAGIYKTADSQGKPFLAIRGISDLVGLERHDSWTIFACKSAAAFAISLIQSGTIPLDINSNFSQFEGYKTFEEVFLLLDFIVDTISGILVPGRLDVYRKKLILINELIDKANTYSILIANQSDKDLTLKILNYMRPTIKEFCEEASYVFPSPDEDVFNRNTDNLKSIRYKIITNWKQLSENIATINSLFENIQLYKLNKTSYWQLIGFKDNEDYLDYLTPCFETFSKTKLNQLEIDLLSRFASGETISDEELKKEGYPNPIIKNTINALLVSQLITIVDHEFTATQIGRKKILEFLNKNMK